MGPIRCVVYTLDCWVCSIRSKCGASCSSVCPLRVLIHVEFDFSSIKCGQKGIHLVSVFTKHNEPVCIFGYTVTALKAKNMVIAECSVSFNSVL